jgi:branched-chain amino acid transport system ATP-binding protein
MSVLAVTGLHVRYGEIPAVRGLDLHLDDGETVAILGRNGAGKTTTLRAIAGTLPTAAGSVRFNDVDVTGTDAARRARVGVVLVPEGRRLFPHLTVRENLAAGAYTRRLGRRELRAEIDRVTQPLELVSRHLDRRAGTLSGGEQQLVAIARALMAAPQLLLIDEPSLGLAPVMTDRVYGLLAELRAERLPIVVVEQYVEVALGLADRAVVMDKGEVVLQGTSAELVHSGDLVNAYLAATEERV